MKTVAGSALSSLAVIAGLAGLGSFATASPANPRRTTSSFSQQSVKRSVTATGDALSGQTYDYVVVGGGLAGLTVAARLSEDPNVTVAVIEAGLDIYGNGDETRFVTPAAVLYDSFLNTDYDWKWVTTAQAGLNGRTTPWARGKVLGGSSSVNSLYMVRPSKQEFDAWGNLIGDTDQWGWDSLFAAMKKSESFEEPVEAVTSMVPSLAWNNASHGTGGMVRTGWPAVSYPMVEAFLQSAAAQGTPISSDPDSGEGWGAFLATSCINEADWTRSSSRRAYLDPIDTERTNLFVLTGHQATKILLDSTDPANVKATGVQYAANASAAVQTVNAAKEVIVSGGTINSPLLLQLSGIGDSTHLSSLGINTTIDLPGVGHNVQDHISAALLYPPVNVSQQPPSKLTGDVYTDSFVQSAIAYVNLTTLLGASEATTLVTNLKNNASTAVNALQASDTVKQAYNATYTSTVGNIYDSPVGVVEILLADIFGTINMQIALQQPLSRGSILLTSSDPFASPAIDPGYLSHESDLQLLIAGHKMARRIAQGMPTILGAESNPGTAAVADDDDAAWEAFIRQNAGTEYHPSSSCSMLPRAQGGVVDANLMVYGTTNLRVIDASVAPTSISAHLMTATYGIAELGAEIIAASRTEADAAIVEAPVGNMASTAGDNSVDSTAAESSEQQQQPTPQSQPVTQAQTSSASLDTSAGIAAAAAPLCITAMIVGRTILRRRQNVEYGQVQSGPVVA